MGFVLHVEIEQMSFKTAVKITEWLPRPVVMIRGFHSLSKYPWNSHYGLWISHCLTFLQISSLQIKMLNLWGDQTIQVSVLWAFYFLGCAWVSYSISWKQKKGPRDLMHQIASCFLNINLTFPTYLVERGVQNTRNLTLTALYVLLSILCCEESHCF